ncbi:MAG: hypothetical protein NWF00_06665 [Candidatus Bathyarchaeota archaeon]|nr:hypothetical protein [Candidatus Bathyarchaeota archaeon]
MTDEDWDRIINILSSKFPESEEAKRKRERRMRIIEKLNEIGADPAKFEKFEQSIMDL